MDNKLIGNENNIVFYTDEEGNTKVEVVLQNEDVWLNVNAIAELFDVQRPAITKHINNIYNENELEEKSTCSKMEHMGLTNWKNSPDGLIYKYDVTIAKNYLNEEELKKLNDLTNFFIVFAEDEAKERHIMTMQNWIDATDDLLKFRRKKVLDNAGSISHKEAIEKAENEYEKFKIKQDMQYISSMDEMYQRYLNENKE